MKRLMLLITAAAALALMALPAAALAKSHDRNHDGIPDKWERHFHLSLNQNQARRDQDHDGLNNKQEFKDQTNPRKADTDGDGLNDGQEIQTANNPNDRDTDNNGVEDGAENSGTISSFDPNSGTLVVDFGNGHTVSGLVTSSTRIECRTRQEQEAENENENEANDATAADHGGSDGSGDGSGDSSGSGDNSGPGSTSSGPGDGNDEGTTCGTGDLTQGTAVHEAELQDQNGGQPTFEKVELIK